MTDFLIVIGVAWLACVPLFAASGLFEFFAWCRRRGVERICGKRGQR